MADDLKKSPVENDDSDKVIVFFKNVKRVGILSFKKVFDLFVKRDELLYDDGSDEMSVPLDIVLRRIIYGVFIGYGFLMGFLMQNYASSLIIRFSAWAAGVEITSSNIPSSPLTIIVSIVVIFVIYLAGIVGQMLIYMLFKKLFASKMYNGLQDVQIGFMYGVLLILLTTILGILIPYNIFL